MSTDRKRIEAKIEYLQKELEDLRGYYYVTETYHYLLEQLDTQQRILKEIEVQEHFAAIDGEQ